MRTRRRRIERTRTRERIQRTRTRGIQRTMTRERII